MDLFDLAAKITLDSSEYVRSMKDASESSKTVQSAVNSLISPIDKAKAAFDALKHPVESSKTGWENLKTAANGIIHPIQTAKAKIDDMRTSAQKQQSIMAGLGEKYDSARKNVEKLTEEYKKSVKESGNTSKESIKLAQKLDQAEKEAAQAEQAMKEYADSVKKTGDESDKAGKKTGKFAEALKKGAGAIAKGSLAAVGAAGAAIGKVVFDSVQSYSEYEQLAGGVNKLFGEGANIVAQNAKKAYATAGMSANEYMQAATSVSSFLINSLDGDTKAAADAVDMAMRDISDNANTYGKYTVEELTGVYQALAKGQYQTLDNLQLGYAGSKEGMEQLIADANKFKEANGEAADLTIDSYADVVEALHIIQTEQHISGLSAEEAAQMVADGVLTQEEAYERMGTTAKEASTTIQGSLGMTKAAWENLLTGLSDPDADIGQLADNLVTSFGSLASNIVPVLSRSLEGIGAAINTVLPTLIPQVVTLITNNLPMLAKTAISMVKTLVKALTDNMDSIIEAAFEIIDTLVEYLSDPDGLTTLIDAAFEILSKLASALGEQLPVLIPAIYGILLDIVEKLTSPENISLLVGAAIDLLMGLAEGFINNVDVLLAKAPTIVQNLVNAIIENAPKLVDAALELVTKLGSFLGEKLEEAWDTVKNIGGRVVEGIWAGISNGYQWIKGKIEGWVGDIMSFFKNILGIHSPSKWAQNVIGKNIVLGMAEGLDENADAVYDSIDDLVNGASEAATIGLDAIDPTFGGDSTMTETLTMDGADGSNNIGAVFSLLQYYLPLLTNRQIVLDSGATVGALAAQMDDALGRRTILAARGMA